jgi:translation initiation factor 1
MARERNSRLVYSTEGPVQPAPRDKRPVARAAGSGIRIRLERRASGRVVTVVTGLPGTAADVQALGRELRSRCGTGGTTREDMLELQGDHRDKVEAVLSRRGLRSRRAGS